MGVEADRDWQGSWNERPWVANMLSPPRTHTRIRRHFRRHPVRQPLPKTNQNLRALTHTRSQTTPRTTPCPTAPPATNQKNLRTLTPILEVRTPIAETILGNDLGWNTSFQTFEATFDGYSLKLQNTYKSKYSSKQFHLFLPFKISPSSHLHPSNHHPWVPRRAKVEIHGNSKEPANNHREGHHEKSDSEPKIVGQRWEANDFLLIRQQKSGRNVLVETR